MNKKLMELIPVDNGIFDKYQDQKDHDLLVVLNVRAEAQGQQLADHEKRLRPLEFWKAKTLGAIAVLLALGGGSIAGILKVGGII